MGTSPFIVGIGGAASPGSSTERALAIAVAAAERAGARVRLFGSATLTALPHYLTTGRADEKMIVDFLAAVREADGLIVASPGYHGSVSGLVKNALDYLEELAGDRRVYLDGVPVGLIATAYGWQATASTLAALRAVVHALRGWPTPLGAAINCSGGLFDGPRCRDEGVSANLERVGHQVFEFVRWKSTAAHDPR